VAWLIDLLYISTAKVIDIRIGIGYLTAPDCWWLEYRLDGTVNTSKSLIIQNYSLHTKSIPKPNTATVKIWYGINQY